MGRRSTSPTVTTATVTSKGQITIPKAIRVRLGIEEGDQVAFVVERGKVSFAPAEQPGELVVPPPLGVLPRLGLPELCMAGYVLASLVSVLYTSPEPLADIYLLYDRIVVPMLLYAVIRLSRPSDQDLRSCGSGVPLDERDRGADDRQGLRRHRR
jgi:AbrB family looped-hinge helix DNA binding protein